jgi:hypothetical protein
MGAKVVLQQDRNIIFLGIVNIKVKSHDGHSLTIVARLLKIA